MKRIVFGLLLTLCISTASFAQVFSTGQTLKKGAITLGAEPLYLVDQEEIMLFVHGGYGLAQGIDLGLKFGMLSDRSYFGADLEYAMNRNFSLVGGFHSFGDFGLDASGLFTFRLASNFLFTTGGDLDINFGNEPHLLLWVPLAFEVGIRRNTNFILEAEMALNEKAYNIIGGGLAFYF